MVLIIATRGSALALWQARHVKALLEAAHDDLTVEIRIQKTTGDRITDIPLASIGDKGLFTKEVDRALLTGEAHVAVHSLKDVPTEIELGLTLGAVSAREDPRDAVVFRPGAPKSLAQLPAGATVGTSSLRRRAQLLAWRPELVVEDLRGNLDTRLRKVAEGDYDAAILALAGIRRLEREDEVDEILEPPQWLPAVGQGALGITIRQGDEGTRAAVAALDDPDTRAATTAERSFLNALEGGCQVPIGALATVQEGALRMHGFVAALDGSGAVRGEIDGAMAEADALGRTLAARLLDGGARPILEAIRAEQPYRPPPAP